MIHDYVRVINFPLRLILLIIIIIYSRVEPLIPGRVARVQLIMSK